VSRMAKPATLSPELQQLHAGLGERGSSQVIVLTDDGVEHIELAREDMNEWLSGQAQALNRQRRGLSLLAVVIALVALGFLGRSLHLETVNASLDGELAALEARAETLGTAIDGVFATANRVTEGQVAPDQADPVAGLDSVDHLIGDTASAFRLYVEFTRRAVDHYTRSLDEEFATIDTDPLKALDLALGDEVSWGGGMSNTAGVGALLNLYVPEDLPSSLQTVARSEHFRDYLPDLNPMQGGRMTSAFGLREHPVTGEHVAHQGIDLVSWDDPRIRAAGGGQVVFAGTDGLSGKRVVVDHGMGIQTVYAHLSEIDVKEGDWLERGQWLGLMGNTGRSDGAHLHYEVRVNDRHIDPLAVFRVARNVQ